MAATRIEVSDLVSEPAPDDVTDEERLRALESYGVLDTPAEEAFDGLVKIAAEVCEAPSALVSLVASERQWFKARIGIEPCETPLNASVCAHALGVEDLLVIPDLSKDRRTRANPLVTGAPQLRFYAGAVLRNAEGHALGSLCVLDGEPRPEGLTALQASVLRELGRQAMGLLEMRRELILSVDHRLEQTRAQRRRETEASMVQAQELKLRLAVDATRIGIFDYDLVTGELSWDARVRELFGVSSIGPVTYEASFLAGVHPDDRQAADAAVRGALDPAGSGVFDVEYRTVAPDGLTRWLAARGQALFANGAATRFVGTVRDITERRNADDRIAATLERYVLVGRVTKDVIWDWDLVNDHVVWNDALTFAYGYPLEEIEPTPGWWLERVHPEDRERVREDIFRVINGDERDWSHEYRFLRADGVFADVFDRGSMIRDGKGRPLRMIGAMFDNSIRKAEEERQELLNGELSHRMKNILAMVQAITSQTLRAAESTEDAQRILSGRLVALSKAHDILLGGKTDGARLSTVIKDTVRLHIDAPGRVLVEGPALEIGPKAALPIVLMMHELATNAAKYGALSNAEGHVEVAWSISGAPGSETVRLVWTERDGPAVEPHGRRGFGARLIERGLAGQLGATVSLDYPRTGVICVFEGPLKRLVERS